MNPIAFPPAFCVTGTDTGVGKSVVSAILTLGLGAAYWKPIQSGIGSDSEPSTDTEFVRQITGLDASHFFPERFRLTQPLSPHAAAAIDGLTLQLSDFALPKPAPNCTHLPKPHLIVEGAGGLRVPINSEQYITDLIRHLELPVILVARSTLGTINHTLLSIECLHRCGIPLLGVVLNGPRNLGNRQAIAHYGKTQILAEIEPLPVLSPKALGSVWQAIASQA